MNQPTHSSESQEESTQRLASLGRALFGAGIGLLVLRGLTLTTRMPGLPASWYSNQSIWVAVGIGLTALGWRILFSPRTPRSLSWRPSVPGRRFCTATLYTGDGCHLCEEAAAMLESYLQWLPTIEQVEIRSDPDLVNRFSTCIPVLVVDGKVRFRGRINEELLRRLIEGAPPGDSSATRKTP